MCVCLDGCAAARRSRNVPVRVKEDVLVDGTDQRAARPRS